MDRAGMTEFHPFFLDTVNQCLWRDRDSGDEERIVLPPKAYGVLHYLIQRAGFLATRDELLDAVWPNTHIQPEGLKNQILHIRRVLNDDPKFPRFIETLPRRGYRFIGVVLQEQKGREAQHMKSLHPPAKLTATRRQFLKGIVASGAVCAMPFATFAATEPAAITSVHSDQNQGDQSMDTVKTKDGIIHFLQGLGNRTADCLFAWLAFDCR